jgi:vancomycin resistance protein VanJ
VTLRSAVAGSAAVLVLAIAVVQWLLFLFRPETGLPGVLQVLAPHLAIVGLLCCLFLLAAPRRWHLAGVIALIAVVALRFGGEWLSLPATPLAADEQPITVETWNLEVFSRPAADTIAMLLDRPADVVALEELQPGTAAAIDADPGLRAAFPYRELKPLRNVLGLGILSRYPIADASVRYDPALLRATLDVDGRPIVVFAAHPLHGNVERYGDTRLPIGIDVSQRNDELVTIRAAVDQVTAGGGQAILLGDLNTASSEPAFDRLVGGLHDAHGEVGQGSGWTWRPISLESLGFGLIRIDHVISTPAIRPLAVDEHCPDVGDHCLVRAELAIS